MNAFSLHRFQSAYARRMAKWFGRRPVSLPNSEPIISFTFDDFPASALSVGGTILRGRGIAATYYTSLGLMGQTTPTGQIFQRDDLAAIREQGHDVGCHTFDHFPAWETPTATYIQSVERNHAALDRVFPGPRLDTHSYPISYPRPGTKRRLQHRFRACRGGGQCVNSGQMDLNYVSSFFLEQSHDDMAAIDRVIENVLVSRGWLIFSTHDISQNRTRFGCTPLFFENVVRKACDSGAKLLSIPAALDLLRVPPSRHAN